MSSLPSFSYCHWHCQKASPSKRSIYNISPGSVVNMTGRINQLSGERKQWQFNKLLGPKHPCFQVFLHFTFHNSEASLTCDSNKLWAKYFRDCWLLFLILNSNLAVMRQTKNNFAYFSWIIPLMSLNAKSGVKNHILQPQHSPRPCLFLEEVSLWQRGGDTCKWITLGRPTLLNDSRI